MRVIPDLRALYGLTKFVAKPRMRVDRQHTRTNEILPADTNGLPYKITFFKINYPRWIQNRGESPGWLTF